MKNMVERSLADDMPTSHKPTTVEIHGFEDDVIRMWVVEGHSVYYIASELTKRMPVGGQINSGHVKRFLESLPPDRLKALVAARQEHLIAKYKEFEEQGINIRQEAMQDLKKLISKEVDEGRTFTVATYKGDITQEETQLTAKDKQQVANVIEKIIKIQESGEKVLNVGGKDGKTPGVNVNIKIDLVAQVREKMQRKKKVIDIEAHEVKG